MKPQSPTIVLTGGGSGGHITPLLSLAHELKHLSPGSQLVYIGQKGDSFDSLKTSSNDFDFTGFIRSGKFRRYHGESFLSHLIDVRTLALNARDFFRVMGAVLSAWRILAKVRPDLVFSKGGFVAVPVGIAARLRGIPIVTHDSDTVPGLANRIIGRWAVWHTTGMPPEYYPYPKTKIRYVGIPISEKISKVTPARQADIKKDLGLPADCQLLLVSGGGNGSRTINSLVLSIAPILLSSNLALHIVHVSGLKHAKQLKDEYHAVLEPPELKRVRVFGFTDDFYKYSGAADLIIGRAGATALSEFATQGKACIIIPSPFLAAGHQLKNAEALAQKDAAAIVSNDVATDELIAIVGELLNNDARRHELATNLASLAHPNAAHKLANILLSTARGKGI